MARNKKKKPSGKLKTYKVWVEQVNQCCFEVKAADLRDAAAKGYRKWKRDYARSYVAYVVLTDTN